MTGNVRVIHSPDGDTLHTEFGIYKVIFDDITGYDALLCCEDNNDIKADNWTQVSDLTGLSSDQYEELDIMLTEFFNFELNERYV